MSIVQSLPITSYCERLNSGIFSEPLNLFTNAFFLVSAIFAWHKLSGTYVTHRRYIESLIATVAVIGIGSASFHAVPNNFTLLLDVVPIYVFVQAVLILLLKKLIRSWLYVGMFTAAFAVVLISALIYVPITVLNGSTPYVIILSSLVGILCWYLKEYGRLALRLLPVLLLFSFAIAARSIDQFACSSVPFGTHFIWHSLAAAASYFAIAFLIQLCEQHKQALTVNPARC